MSRDIPCTPYGKRAAGRGESGSGARSASNFFAMKERCRRLVCASWERNSSWPSPWRAGLQSIDEDDDMLSAMARELVERNGIGETADAVWKALNAEHQKLFPTAPQPNHDASC